MGVGEGGPKVGEAIVAMPPLLIHTICDVLTRSSVLSYCWVDGSIVFRSKLFILPPLFPIIHIFTSQCLRPALPTPLHSSTPLNDEFASSVNSPAGTPAFLSCSEKPLLITSLSPHHLVSIFFSGSAPHFTLLQLHFQFPVQFYFPHIDMTINFSLNGLGMENCLLSQLTPTPYTIKVNW